MANKKTLDKGYLISVLDKNRAHYFAALGEGKVELDSYVGLPTFYDFLKFETKADARGFFNDVNKAAKDMAAKGKLELPITKKVVKYTIEVEED
jgi:hypothetical protein